MNFCTSPTPCPPTGTRTQSVTPKRTSQFPGRVSDSSALKLVFALAVFPPPPGGCPPTPEFKTGFLASPVVHFAIVFFVCVLFCKDAAETVFPSPVLSFGLAPLQHSSPRAIMPAKADKAAENYWVFQTRPGWHQPASMMVLRSALNCSGSSGFATRLPGF